MTSSIEPATWSWSVGDRSFTLRIDAENMVQTGSWEWSRPLSELDDYYFVESFPLEVQEPVLRHLVKLPELPSMAARTLQRRAFWRHFPGIEVVARDVALPDSMVLKIGPLGLVHGMETYAGWNTTSAQTWDRFLLDGPEAWQVPLEIRRELRAQILARLDPSAGIDDANAFPLIDYDRVEAGSWQEEKDNHGEFLTMSNGRMEVGGWDNPRDGGSISRSFERFLLAPGLPTLLSALEPVIRARLTAAIVS